MKYFQKKYTAAIVSAIIFPLILLPVITIFSSVSFSSIIPDIIYFLCSFTLIAIISYFLVKPIQIFLNLDTSEDIDEITALTYRIPFINTILITCIIAGLIVFHILFTNRQEACEFFTKISTALISMIIYTYFIASDIMVSIREILFTKKKIFPVKLKATNTSIWKRTALTFLLILLIHFINILVNSYIRTYQIRHMDNLYEIKTVLLTFNRDIIVNTVTMGIILIPVYYFFTRSITEPIKRLIKAMNKVKEGDFEFGVPVISNDEIGIMAGGFNQMSASLFSYRTLLRQRINRLTLLYNVSQAGNHIEDIDKLLSFILDALLNALNSEKISVMLIDEDRKKLLLKSCKGNYRNESWENEFNLGKGIAGTVAKTGEIIVANRGHKDHRFLIRPDIKSDYQIRNLICVPMIIKEQVIGVMNVCNKKNDLDYDSDDVDLLTTISAQIAGFIERSRLREIEIEHIKREKFLYMGRVAAGVAHEIKNPLNAIGMIVQRFKREFKPVIEEAEYFSLLEIITHEVSRVNNIIDRFLKFARPQELKKSSVDFSSIVKEIIILFTLQAQEKGIFIEESLKEDLYCQLDRDQIKQAIMNIFINAIEATKKGKIQISTEQKGNNIYLRIKDTGPGIPEEEKSKIFELYFTTKSRGNGIGLCIAQKIIEQHMGKIDVKSIAGKGTEFIIILPASS